MKIVFISLVVLLLTACQPCNITDEDLTSCDKDGLYNLILNKQKESHSIRAAVNSGWDAFNSDYQTWVPFIEKWETILDRLIPLESGSTQTAARELRLDVVNLLDEDQDFRKGAFRRISTGHPVGKLDALEQARNN